VLNREYYAHKRADISAHVLLCVFLLCLIVSECLAAWVHKGRKRSSQTCQVVITVKDCVAVVEQRLCGKLNISTVSLCSL